MPLVYVSRPMQSMHGAMYRRHCSPCSPGGCNLLALAGLVLFLPMILRVAACLFLWALPVLSFIAMAKFASCVCAEMCDDEDTQVKLAAAAKSACPCPSSARPRPEFGQAEAKSCRKETGTVREALAKEEAGTDDVIVRIQAPGVKPSDLTVSVVDGTLTVKGETTTGSGACYSVERSLHAPRGVELERATCTAADGIVTLTIPRKLARSIPVVSTPIHVQPAEPASEPVEAASEASSQAEEKKGDASDADEWVEMPRGPAKSAGFSDS